MIKPMVVAVMLVLGCTETAVSPLSLDDVAGSEVGDVFGCATGNDCDDGLFCTVDTCTESGCRHEVAPYYCAIDGVCVPDLPGGWEAPDGNPCLDCQPDVDPKAWTATLDGFPLSDGLICCDGQPLKPEDCD